MIQELYVDPTQLGLNVLENALPQIDSVSATDNLCQTSYPFFAVIRNADELFRYLTAIEESI